MQVIIKQYIILCDESDKEFIESHTWYAYGNFRNRIEQPYFRNKLGILHRLLINCPKGMFVDHINGNTLDNRKENLRICLKIQNQYNQKKHQGKRHSQYKGVTFRKELKTKPWESFIYKDGIHKRLGYFKTEIEAAQAYDKAAKIAYGDFAKLNFSEDI